MAVTRTVIARPIHAWAWISGNAAHSAIAATRPSSRAFASVMLFDLVADRLGRRGDGGVRVGTADDRGLGLAERVPHGRHLRYRRQDGAVLAGRQELVRV